MKLVIQLLMKNRDDSSIKVIDFVITKYFLHWLNYALE